MSKPDAKTLREGLLCIEAPCISDNGCGCIETIEQAILKARRDAYLQGFLASCEGYNGEYPFGDNSSDPASNAKWLECRDEILAASPTQGEGK